MGRKIERKYFILFTLFIQTFLSSLFSQTIISGKVIDDSLRTAIQFTNIVLKKGSDSLSIIAYSYSKENGEYELETNNTGTFGLSFSALGYQTKSIQIEISKNEKEIIKNITLKEKSFELDEVIINAELPISIKKDTISFKTKYFIKGNEVVVEDLLKTIPGLNIDSEGTIKVGNQEIEKLMIDGDDFFEKGYKILSKNMPSYPIEEVEILKHYSNNRLLKGIEESNKVALNLKLNEKSKRIWFGNIEIGYGNDNFYDLKANLMNFGKKNKYYFLTNLNNVGYDATGDINHLIRSFRFGQPASIGDNQSANTLLNLSSVTPNFKASRTNFNNTELASLNAIFTVSKKIKLKTLGFFNWDENDFFRNSTQIFTSNATDFTNTEDFNLRNKKFTGFGKIDLSYDISKTKMLEITTKYNNQDEDSNSNLIFNGASTIENLQSNNTLFDQKITYTNKFKSNKVFLLTARYIDEKTPQNYIINQFFYQDLFPTSSINANNVVQLSENKMQFAGFEAHLLDRKANGNLLELQFGNQYRKDKLNAAFTLFEDNTALDIPSGFQNNTTYTVNDLYVNTKYRLKLKDFALTGKLDIHQLFNELEFENTTKQQPFFINPSFGVDWEINKKNKITSSYSYNTSNAKILDVYNDFVLTSFRSFSKGTGTFNQLDASSIVFNYQLGNWSDRFFANTFVLYSKNHDFFSSNTLINQNFTQSERIVIKDRTFFNASSKLDYYFKKISSNLKLDVGYSKSNYKNIINNSDLREVKSTNYNYGFELRSGFQGIFNYHYGLKWSTNEIKSTIQNSFTNNISFLDLSFDFNSKVNVQLQNERYFFGNIDNGNNTYYFMDLEARYNLTKNKLTFSLSGKNLFNTETFRTFSISDISTSTTQYRLLPRYILLKMEYRF